MKLHRIFCLLLGLSVVIGVVLTTVNHASAGTIYYVATTGNDGNPGTLAQPWRTIQHSADTVSAGDTVLVRGGVYNESVFINVSGSAGAGHITFQNYLTETPILDGGGALLCGFCIDSEDYLIIDGFEIRNYHSNINWTEAVGIKVEGNSDYIQLLNNRVHDISTSPPNPNNAIANGIAVYGTSAQAAQHITIDGNEVYNLTLGWSESLVLNGNVDTFTVTNNIVHDNNNIGIDIIGHEPWIDALGVPPALNEARNGLVARNHVYNIDADTNPVYGGDRSAPGIYVDGGSNVIVEHNIVHDSNFGMSFSSENMGYDSYNVIVRSNFVYHNHFAGIITGAGGSSLGGARDNAIVNNTLFHNNQIDADEGEFWIQWNVRDTKIQNNIIYAGPGNTLIANWVDAPINTTIDNNIFYGGGSAASSNWAWDGNYISGFANWQAITGNDANSQWVDPQLVDEVAPDLHISALSDAVDAGVNLAEIGLLDIDQQARVQGTLVDIGADEVSSSPPTAIALSEQGQRQPPFVLGLIGLFLFTIFALVLRLKFRSWFTMYNWG